MGPPGTGKTTLAMHVAAQLGRPVLLIHGDDEFGTLRPGRRAARFPLIADRRQFHSLGGQDRGNFTKTWVDHRLTSACKYGFTVIYDEFNRSRPEANNILLSILEERLLELPVSRMNDGYISVHHDFAMIFTSNPEEYAGVHKTQDALMDRMITITVDHYDRETEIDITKAKSGLDQSLGGHRRRHRTRVPPARNPESPPYGAVVHQTGQDLGHSPGPGRERRRCFSRNVL